MKNVTIQNFSEIARDWAGDDGAPGSMTHEEWEHFSGVEDFDALRISCNIGESEIRSAVPNEAAEVDRLAEMAETREPTEDEIERFRELRDEIFYAASNLWAEQIVCDVERHEP